MTKTGCSMCPVEQIINLLEQVEFTAGHNDRRNVVAHVRQLVEFYNNTERRDKK